MLFKGEKEESKRTLSGRLKKSPNRLFSKPVSFGFFSGFGYILDMRTSNVDPFWERVKRLIRAHKISQKKFASYINMSYDTLRSWLKFNRIPDVYTACDIADALGVSMEYLVRGTDGKAAEGRERQVIKRKTAAADIKKLALKIKKDACLIG